METPPFAVPGLSHFVSSKVDFFVGVLLGLSLALLLRRRPGVRKKEVKGDEDGATSPRISAAGPIYCSLCQHLYGGPSPFDCVLRRDLPAPDHSYLHTNVPSEFLEDLLRKLKASFLIELGSFKGGSARRIAAAAAGSLTGEGKPCLLCVDTFLGDTAMWLDHNGWRQWLMMKHGLPQLYMQFLANVWEVRNIVLPLPLSSLCALRALQRLTVRGDVPLADFIYLDAAHEMGETLLEMVQAFRLLRGGGILLGDDLDWPAVQGDLRQFLQTLDPAACCGADDDLLSGIPGLFYHAEAGRGYWILDSRPRQWLVRKSGRSESADLSSLQRTLQGEELGASPAEFLPLTEADAEAQAIYDEAVKLSEAGKLSESIEMFKRAAELSESLAYHYKL